MAFLQQGIRLRRMLWEQLRIALRHLDNFRPYNDHPATGRLLCRVAAWTDVEPDLVARTALVVRSTQYLARHLEQCRIVVADDVVSPSQFGHRFPEEREGLRAHFEA